MAQSNKSLAVAMQELRRSNAATAIPARKVNRNRTRSNQRKNAIAEYR